MKQLKAIVALGILVACYSTFVNIRMLKEVSQLSQQEGSINKTETKRFNSKVLMQLLPKVYGECKFGLQKPTEELQYLIVAGARAMTPYESTDGYLSSEKGDLLNVLAENKFIIDNGPIPDFNKANMSNANIDGGVFYKGRFHGADFSNSVLTNSNFDGADLTGAVFDNSDLTGSTFNGASLYKASFWSVDTSKINFTGAKYLNTIRSNMVKKERP